MNSASSIALSTKYCFAKFGLSESIVSIIFLAQSKVAANKIACFRSSVILDLDDWCAEEGATAYFFSHNSQNISLAIFIEMLLNHFISEFLLSLGPESDGRF